MEYPAARLLIFAKAPIPGVAKTRLIPALGAAGAAALHAALLHRTLERVTRAPPCPVELHCTPTPDHPAFRDCAARYPITLHRQAGGDLGARLHHAFATAPAAAVAIGTDCPDLDGALVRQALALLAEGVDAVVGPAEDGGYVLLGLRRPSAAPFREIPWGSGRVLAVTRERLAAAGLAWRELPPLYDIDRPEELSRLRGSGMEQALYLSGAASAPRQPGLKRTPNSGQ